MRAQSPTNIDWEDLVRTHRLSVLTDLDGTLIPFAASAEEAALDAEVAAILRALLAVGVRVVVVSGRPRPLVDHLRVLVPGAAWVAEHGGWYCEAEGEWTCAARAADDLERLAIRLAAICDLVDGARVERKTASVCLHWRSVTQQRQPELLDAVDLLVDEWLEGHSDHERMQGAEMLEVGPRQRHKGAAVAWVRARFGNGRIIALGDDVTDEHMFAALDDDDLAVAVGVPGRPTRAALTVDGVEGARRLLRWIVAMRAGVLQQPAPVTPLGPSRSALQRGGLLVVSNRMASTDRDGRRREVGGLVAALEPALVDDDATWLGWSGRESDDPEVMTDATARPRRATFDLTPLLRERYYAGFCNRSLWPLLHGFPGRVRYENDEWSAYVEANEVFARLAGSLVAPDGTVWAHDYHLCLLAVALRRRGHSGPLGLFFHVPFPALDVFETLPWAREVLDGMLAYDLIGFHTSHWAQSFITTACALTGAREIHGNLVLGGKRTVIATRPLGIDAAPFRHDRALPPCPEIEGLRLGLRGRKLLLGVDRLDYSKGIPERLQGFARLLERYPQWRGQVSFVQISVPSRADVPEYAELRSEVEHLVGSINGRFGEADWMPVRYLYRSYTHDILAQIYRVADVAMVTPLRDGMNLVAKEFVAAQDPTQPGVLVLSRFAGAAEELRAAIQTNPFHCDGLADDMARALSMPADERRARHALLRDVVLASTPVQWAGEFLDTLESCRTQVSRARSATS